MIDLGRPQTVLGICPCSSPLTCTVARLASKSSIIHQRANGDGIAEMTSLSLRPDGSICVSLLGVHGRWSEGDLKASERETRTQLGAGSRKET